MLLGNSITIELSNFAPILKCSDNRIRSYHIQKVGAPAIRRRISAGTSIKNANWVTCVASAPLVDGYPEYDRLLPCPAVNHPPRVEHLVVVEEGHVCDYISRTLDLPPLYVADLIRFGVVYYALVHPKPPATATPEQVHNYVKFTSPHLLKQRMSLEGKTIQEAQKTFRITRIDEHVEVGTYLRVYVHPRRFPRCYEIDWKSRILAVTDSYVVLDKPAGTTVGGTSNNIEESCVNFATRALGLTTPLLTTHQIDNCTEGCVVMARNEQYCSIFHGNIRDKKVKKLYLALVAAPVSCQIITHYMQPARLAPRIVSEEFLRKLVLEEGRRWSSILMVIKGARKMDPSLSLLSLFPKQGEYMEGWQICQLEVLECKKVPWPNSITEDKYQIKDCGWPVKVFAYECKINLLTGRTHQIRAQLAACGAPLIGDSMYMPAALAELTKPGVSPFGKWKREYTCDDEKKFAIENWISLHGKEPSLAIGLQACQISWDDDDDKHAYEAGFPWWSRGLEISQVVANNDSDEERMVNING